MPLQDYQKLYLDNNIPINKSFYCNNGDLNTRGIEVHVLENAQAKDCTGLTLKLIVRVPSGEYFLATATPLTIASGIYQVLFPNNMGKGRFIAELQLSEAGGNVLVSRKFSIVGDGSLTSDGTIKTTPEGGLLWTALQSVDAAVAAKFADLEAQYATDLTSVKSQLADNVSDRTSKTGLNRKCYLTIIDDDAKSDLFTKLKPTLDAHNVKISLAINPSFIGQAGYLTWEQVQQFKAEGHEIINHGWIGTSAELMTLAEMQSSYALEKAKFEEKALGNGYDYYVYSGTQPVGNAALKTKIKQVYKCCYANYLSKQSYLPFDNYEIKRYPIQISGVKPYIDFCIDNNAYCVLMSHSYVAELTAAYLDDLLTYIESKGASIEYRSAMSMVDTYENQIENGNTGGDYFFLDKNGNADFSVQGMSANEIVKNVLSLGNRFSFPSPYFSDKLITDYTPDSITVESIENAMALKLGLPEAGTVTTYRWYKSVVTPALYFSYQEYVPFSRNELWMRKWNSTRNRWDMYTPVSKAIVTTATRPRYAEVGVAIFDTTLVLPIWCKTKGYKANKTIARSTAFNKWDVVYTNFANYMCVQAGTTDAITPTWLNGSGTLTPDGTAIWEWVGADAVYINGAGATV